MSPDFAFKVFLKCIPPFRPPVSLFQDTLIPTLDDDLLADLSAIAAPVSNASIILSIPSAAMIYSRVSTVLDSTIKGPPINWPCPFPALVPAATVSFLPFRQCPLPWLRPPPPPPPPPGWVVSMTTHQPMPFFHCVTGLALPPV